MSYGPAPWQQENWDWRAAGNFIAGGTGGGLIAFTALAGAQGLVLTMLILAGLALVGVGLMCVWLEIGRPLRALHVFFNPRTSWMTREAFTATLLFPVGMATAAGVPGFASLAAVLAVAFVYCQSRMLQSAKGIPAWREPLLSPLIVLTGLTEGGGVFLLAAPLHGGVTQSLLWIFVSLLLARVLVWLAYRRRLSGTAAPGALAALDTAGRLLQLAGTFLPLALIALVAVGVISGGAMIASVALVGFLAATTGSYMKYTLVTRAGFNQGFALAHLPVRGKRP